MLESGWRLALRNRPSTDKKPHFALHQSLMDLDYEGRDSDEEFQNFGESDEDIPLPDDSEEEEDDLINRARKRARVSSHTPTSRGSFTEAKIFYAFLLTGVHTAHSNPNPAPNRTRRRLRHATHFGLFLTFSNPQFTRN